MILGDRTFSFSSDGLYGYCYDIEDFVRLYHEAMRVNTGKPNAILSSMYFFEDELIYCFVF